HRIEEDDFDVEQDEQHRDQVEGHPEPEGLRDLGRQSAFVRVGLPDRGAGRCILGLLRPEDEVERREGSADDYAESCEYENWEVLVKQTDSFRGYVGCPSAWVIHLEGHTLYQVVT